MAALQYQDADPCFLHIPFTQRWQYLKPVIKQLYVEEGYDLGALVKTMKESYKFDASEHQYKYQFGKWRFGKSVPRAVKEEACKALGKRSRDAMSTSVVEYKGEEIDKTKLRRHMIALARQQTALRLSNNIFIHWNLPYKALKASRMGMNDISSPFDLPTATPDYIHVASPAYGQGGPSPRDAFSPNNAPTPTMIAIRNKEMGDRAKLLIQGRHEELLNSMQKHERQIATTWLYQFWLFSYKTAKHWGRGPLDWSASVLRFTDFQDLRTAVNTPQTNIGTPMEMYNSDAHMHDEHTSHEDLSNPSSLCFWSIHAADQNVYERDIPSPPPEPIEDFDALDEDDWPSWPGGHQIFNFVQKLQAALKSNSFSSVDIGNLPLSLSQVSKAAEQSPDQLLVEALGFAIMARNEDLLWDLIEEVEVLDLSSLSPFHLAASYLSGAKTCCNIVDFVVRHFAGPEVTQQLYVNPMGHTVLDTLMIGILKSHTSCLPSTVDDRLTNDKRFAGEELDVCGRWDADSPCIRKLLAAGNLIIPLDWKHMFCHTSTQAVCHSIGTIFGTRFGPDINTSSGLFLKRCYCGRQLQLRPLHSLVMIAFHLAQNGRPGENLFGVLACLVCLLVNGMNPLLTAHVSMDSLIGRDNNYECSHSNLDPAQLAEQIPEDLTSEWTDEVKLGWSVFRGVLHFAQDERRKGPNREPSRSNSRGYDVPWGFFTNQDFEDEDESMGEYSLDEEEDEEVWCQHHKIHGNFYDGSKDIGLLWAAIQTELLTYRKIEVNDPWISNNFVMNALLAGLRNGFGVSLLPLVDKEMMKPVCRCGRFRDADDEACAMVQETSAYYFSNTDIWKRATYIVVPEIRNDLWYPD